MKAAIITSPEAGPRYGDFKEPEAAEGEAVISVTAAPISPIVRTRAAMKPASDDGKGFVVGVDGVGKDASGRYVYFLFPKAPFDALAERTLVPAAMTVPVPDGLSDIRAAAIATAGLASWDALTRRVPIKSGQTVLVTGANGAAGRLALNVARHLGAGRTIAVVRSADKLDGLAADTGIALDARDADDALKAVFDVGVDVVLDFVWGSVAERVLTVAMAGRGSPAGEPRCSYLVLGTLGGTTVPLSGYGLQSSGLDILGAGIGSVPVRDYLASAGELMAAAQEAGWTPPCEVVPLADIASVWKRSGEVRYIIHPDVTG
ncbi:quinone oxidoreductase family protein [Martelella soudanensis]|uniref:quinone oxidoreductase family protein n=1 Tax=unclassified Martelella TaxID=2629616 RepID=UPI0015DF6E07|nr:MULTISPECIES: zinc-binding alcohol dehydrogenase family protein [unclassified Martelella]